MTPKTDGNGGEIITRQEEWEQCPVHGCFYPKGGRCPKCDSDDEKT